jgi:putative hydrolase of HD superfamily
MLMDPERAVGFLRYAGRLKGIRRTGWVESGVGDPESVADHSYRTALLAMVLADAEGADTLAAVRMALLHDLAEAECGDMTPRMKEADPGWMLREEEAAAKILGLLPEPLRERYLDSWREYTRGESREARLVHAADKLEMLLQAREYVEAGEDAGRLMRFRHVEVRGESAERLAETIKHPKKT